MSELRNVAILGCDSTHIDAFIPHLQKLGVRIISLFDQDQAVALEAADRLGLEPELVCDDIVRALQSVDLSLIVGRFADSHFDPAMASIARGIPTFVDKPFTDDPVLALKMCNLAAENQVPLFSCSPLRFSIEVTSLAKRIALSQEDISGISVLAPANCIDIGDDPRFDSNLFYGIHGVDICSVLSGDDFDFIGGIKGPTSSNLNFQSRSGLGINLQLIRNIMERYEVYVFHKDRETELITIKLDGSYYDKMIDWLVKDFPQAGYSQRLSDSLCSGISAVTELDEIDNG